MDTPPPDAGPENSISIRRDIAEMIHGGHPGDYYIRRRATPPAREAAADFSVVPGVEPLPPRGLAGRAFVPLKRLLVGHPLATHQESSERVTTLTGLAIFASDNISSSAYATEEIMRILVLAGVGALALTLPLTLVICAVLAIVVLSYRQVIAAYPNGGGSYVVAKDNLGSRAGLTAAAALLTDYILTVSVSTAAGVAALTSAFPGLFPYRVSVMLGLVAFMTLMNLRGIRESGKLFALPTYIYLGAICGLLGYGLVRFATNTLPAYTAPPEWLAALTTDTQTLGLLLLLRAFASGSVALTGTEAVSNGVPAFRPPEIRNAQIVLLLMGGFFATIFLGMSLLTGQIGIIPDPAEQQTVVSQLARVLVGTGPYFYLVQFSTTVLLILAANTSFNGFPRLASVLAQDRYLPRIFQFRGDRLAFSGGIVVLAVLASLLIVLFDGSVTAMIPLYTVGVFIAFTLSQAGLVRHWWRLRGTVRGWRARAAINALGALTTGLVAVEVAYSKFLLGAWMVLVLIPLLIALMWGINRHYHSLEGALRAETPIDPAAVRLRPVIPIAALNIPVQQAIAFARAIAPDEAITVIHVTDNLAETAALRRAWARQPHGRVQLVVIESPYRSLARPLLRYLDTLCAEYPHDTMMVVLPEFVPGHWWEQLLHNQTALRLKAALLFEPGIIVANVPYHVSRSAAANRDGMPPADAED